jgi:hypothetical protein
MPASFLYDLIDFASPVQMSIHIILIVRCYSEFTCAVRGGKYSNDHHTLSVLVAASIFSLILIAKDCVRRHDGKFRAIRAIISIRWWGKKVDQ